MDVDNSKDILRPGAYVFVHFHLPSSQGGITIPSSALLFRAEGLRVGVVHNDRVQLVPVTIGSDYGNFVKITSGLTSADEVILNPADSLTDGQQVQPVIATALGQS